MKCSEVEEKLILAESGELEPAGRAELEEHLSQCESCREFARQIRAMLTEAGPAPEMPETLEKQILESMAAQSVAERKSAVKPVKRFAVMLMRDFGIAAAVAAVVIIMFLFMAEQPHEAERGKPAESIAKTQPQLKAEETDKTIAKDLRKAIRELDSTRATSLGESFTNKLDRFKDGVEAARFMQSTPGKSGLEREIDTVKKKIEKLKTQMTTLALYTEQGKKKTILDNGR